VRSRQVTTLVRIGASASDAVVSPDGRWLAYSSDQTGRLEVYVAAFARADRAVQVSTEGGRNPRWSPEGQELFFPNTQGLFSARVIPGPAFRTETPRLLFRGQFQGEFDVARGAREFLMVTIEGERRAAVPLHLVLNWIDELSQRAQGSTDRRNPH
jgi:dipeptidyl aminopeptidase/acylaminoacyl peptidase